MQADELHSRQHDGEPAHRLETSPTVAPQIAGAHDAAAAPAQPIDWDGFERDIACLLQMQPAKIYAAGQPAVAEVTSSEAAPALSRPFEAAEFLEAAEPTEPAAAPPTAAPNPLSQYRAKAEQLKVKAHDNKDDPISRAALESLALSYLRLADYEERHQQDLKEKAWVHLARENGWRCQCGHLVSYCDREVYFATNLCARCYRAMSQRSHRAGRPQDQPGRVTAERVHR